VRCDTALLQDFARLHTGPELMDALIFGHEPMGLREDMLSKPKLKQSAPKAATIMNGNSSRVTAAPAA